MAEKKVKAWHFVNGPGRTLQYDAEKLVVKPGYVYSMGEDEPDFYGYPSRPECCTRGMHGSRKILQALGYARSTVLSRVVIWGDIDETEDKLCGRHRRVYEVKDIYKPSLKLMREIAKREDFNNSLNVQIYNERYKQYGGIYNFYVFITSQNQKIQDYAEKYLASLFERI